MVEVFCDATGCMANQKGKCGRGDIVISDANAVQCQYYCPQEDTRESLIEEVCELTERVLQFIKRGGK